MSGYTSTAASEAADDELFDLQHQVFCKIFGTHRAPLDFTEPLRVLDVGCGNGSWSAELVRNQENVKVMGIDTASFDSWYASPVNCAFEVTDMEDDDFWDRCDGRYDFVHTRCLVTACRDWPDLIRRCHGALKPGGWLEMQDIDSGGLQLVGSERPSPCKSLAWSDAFSTSLALAGYLADAMQHIPSYMANASFEQLTTEDYRMPIGDWPEALDEREVGILCLADLEYRVHSLSHSLFTDMLGMTDEQATETSDAFVNEVRRGEVHSYFPLRLTYARKPLAITAQVG